MKFELPSLPPGWQWQPLTPQAPNELGEYTYVIQAINKEGGKFKFVRETVSINLKKDSSDSIKRLFSKACAGMAKNARLLSYTPNEAGVLALEEIFETFKHADDDPVILA